MDHVVGMGEVTGPPESQNDLPSALLTVTLNESS
jgi:hypothetical protein